MTNGGLKHATTRQQNLKPFSNLGTYLTGSAVFDLL